MSYATGTTHYNLPQTAGSDKRDWSDTNAAFAAIDTAIYQAASDASSAASAASSAQTTANAAQTAATSAASTASAAQTTANSASETANQAKTAAQTATSTANTANTNASAAQTDASNALSAIGTLANLVTTAKNNLVAAINEVATKTNTNTNNMGNLNNLQTTAKNNLVAAINEVLSQVGGGIMLLDFSSAVNIKSSSAISYTAPSDGALIGSLRSTSGDSGVFLSINGNNVSQGTINTGTPAAVTIYGVKSGDTIATTRGIGTDLLFVPYAN